MRSYTSGRSLYQSLTKNSAAANLTLGTDRANDYYKKIGAMKSWPFLDRTRTILTTGGTQFKPLPYDVDKVKEVSLTIGTTRYVLKNSPSREHWDHLNLTSFTSDIPVWYYVTNGQMGIWPTPATSSNTITITARVKVIDLSIADYTTGTIVSIANGATTVTGSGTSWTSQMTGRFIRITLLDTANTGDGQWYEISSVTSTTTLELVRSYGGSAISAGSAAYTIGQMPLLPEEIHDIPWIKAIADYWRKENDERVITWDQEYATGIKQLESTWSSATDDYVIDNGTEKAVINPNLTIQI